MTRLKVCCIASAVEARLAVEAGAHAVGLVGPMPTGPGTLAEDAVAPIAAGVPPGVSRFWLTAHTDPDEIAALAARLRVDVVQCVRAVAPQAHRRLAAAAPWLRRVQVVHVEGAGALALMRSGRG
jgi:phosphoribosylanthranilate isomerase